MARAVLPEVEAEVVEAALDLCSSNDNDLPWWMPDDYPF